MTFKKNNKLGAKKILPFPLDEQPICFKGYKGQKSQLKAVPNWQERLRKYVAQLIAEGE
ncbi:MAG: hypothetical protein RIG63_26870 [Coleofasciculus chthonoplastes F3-SA18-01]|uniref:hypothetical protein n=1 Tax=Coleofasciculus chthonoplastes TaxID=64178 RepID=UPI0032FF5336